MSPISDYYGKQNDIEHRFSPYADNGGTTVGIAGKDFAVIGSDTRLASGYSVLTRDQTKCFKLTPTTIFSSTGCWADVLTLKKVLEARLTIYEHTHLDVMSVNAIAQLLSTLLYSRRFFPYYVSTALVGIDEEGKGAVYTYDPVGHMERVNCFANGSSKSIIEPLLDNQVDGLNMTQGRTRPLDEEFTKTLIQDSFISASERDIYCGDGYVIYTVTKAGIKEEFHKLRID